MRISEELTTALYQNLTKKLDELIVEGLDRKGYKFEDKEYLEVFIRNHCSIEQRGNTKTFLVKGVPFMHLIESPQSKMCGNEYTVSLGEYDFM